MRFFPSALLASLMVAAPLKAATFNISYGIGFAGGVPDGSIGLFVVDTAGDGFVTGDALLGEDLTVGTFLGADDFIAHVAPAVDFGGTFGFQGDGVSLNDAVDPVAAGNDVAVLWLNAPVTDPVAGGTTGGLYRSDDGDAAFGSQPWELILGPAQNNFGFDGNFGGSESTAAFSVNNFTVVPEPSSALLAMIAGVGVLLRRRR